MESKRKRQIGEQNQALIEMGCKAFGMRCEVFSPIHLRIYGAATVDYWPTVSKGWVLGNRGGAQKMTAREAVDLARGVPIVVDEDLARSHMQSIAEDDGSPPPW
jgi:hypothetical protein